MTLINPYFNDHRFLRCLTHFENYWDRDWWSYLLGDLKTGHYFHFHPQLDSRYQSKPYLQIRLKMGMISCHNDYWQISRQDVCNLEMSNHVASLKKQMLTLQFCYFLLRIMAQELPILNPLWMQCYPNQKNHLPQNHFVLSHGWHHRHGVWLLK